MIKILKASAGSGKTWNLALEYIKILLGAHDTHAYRHILAVTFTNKATDEMKERILEKLHELSKDPRKSDYYEKLVPEVCPDETTLRNAAGELLCNILHDYSAFAVSTIDRFFQQTLKAFAREIGHFSSYSVELDKASLIRESVDRLLDSLTDGKEHSRSLEWMIRKTMSQLEDGEGYRLDHTLRKVAERFNSEEYRVALEESGVDETVLYSDERLDLLQTRCDEIVERFISDVKAAAESVAGAFVAAGIEMGDTSAGFMEKNIAKFLALSASKPVQPPTAAFRKKAADGPAGWFARKNNHLEGRVTGAVTDAVDRFFGVFDAGFKVYNTALALKLQIYGFAVANDLYHHFREILKEKNVMTIDQTNGILRKIIDDADAPFVYEKTGVRYEHFLLDEFQDTSKVQWENFRPLLKNSISQGFFNLIVGDVKQSIYRWRQSDWSLLDNQVEASFSEMVEKDKLQNNYRSCKGIVDFNSEYFRAAAEFLDKKYHEDCKVLQSIYSDVRQEAVKGGDGLVETVFCQDERFYPTILESINKAVCAGYRLGDITVLVRLNQEGADIASYLIEQGIPVLSDDSLKVSSSLTVRRLVSLLSGIDNPEDKMATFLARSMNVDIPQRCHSLVDLCEALLRGLRRADPDTFAAEVLYVQSFMDIVQEFTMAHGNSVRAFLKKWADDRSNISSPKSDDAVRIMTVHKSKGLDFPYVIFPSLGSVGFFAHGAKWSEPDVKGTDLEDVAGGVYDVHLSGKSVDTLFENRYKEEVLMQYVDNINILYVAFTRAAKAMTIISPIPEEEGFSLWTLGFMEENHAELGFVKECSEDGTEVAFRKGEFPDPPALKHDEAEKMTSEFCSYEGDRTRLRLSADSRDFFSDEGQTGMAASSRIRGVILHDVLSRILHPSDLDEAVRSVMLEGAMTKDEAGAARELLSQAISEVETYGWFPEDTGSVLNETEIVDSDGKIYRPDRVVVTKEKVMVIDFKFGDHYIEYEKQVSRYAGIWRRMGYKEVSAYLWYVQDGKVMQIL